MPELRSKLPRHFTFSQSSLQDYSDCPRRFQLRYMEELAWPAIETFPVLENESRQKEGQLFHRLIQQQIIGLPEEKLTRLAQSTNLERWWRNYLENKPGNSGYTQYAELALSVQIGTKRLMAKYDLVAVNLQGQAVIFDWKTSHKRPRDEWLAARWQTRAYLALLVQVGAYLNHGTPFQPEQIDMVYWFAEFPSDSIRFHYSNSQYQRDWEALTSLISEIGNHRHFPLAENEKICAYCPYRSYCSRGIEAGDWQEQDEGEKDVAPEFNINLEQVAEIEF